MMSSQKKFNLNFAPVDYQNKIVSSPNSKEETTVFVRDQVDTTLVNSISEQKNNLEIDSLVAEKEKAQTFLRQKRQRLFVLWGFLLLLTIILLAGGLYFWHLKKDDVTQSALMQDILTHTEQIDNLVKDLDYQEVKSDIQHSMNIEVDAIDPEIEKLFDDSEATFLAQKEKKEKVKKVFPQDIIPVYFDAQIIDFKHDTYGNYYGVKMAFLPKDFNQITKFYQENLTIVPESFKTESIETEIFKDQKDEWFYTITLTIKPQAKVGLLQIVLSRKGH